MSDEVPDLRGGNLKTAAFIVGPLLGAAALVGGIIWAMAKYPDRPEFDEARRETRSALIELSRRQASIEKDVAVQTVKVDAIGQSQVRIEAKLDRRK